MTEYHAFRRLFLKGRIYVQAPDVQSALYKLDEIGLVSIKDGKDLRVLKSDVSVPDGKCQKCKKTKPREALYKIHSKTASLLCEDCKKGEIGIDNRSIGFNF